MEIKETTSEYIARRTRELDKYEQDLKDKKNNSRNEALVLFKRKKCKQCRKRVLLIFAYYDQWCSGVWEFSEGLCVDHAPKMSDGSPGYKEVTIREVPNPRYKSEEPEEFKLSDPPKDACIRCGKKVIIEADFALQTITNGNQHDSYTLPAVPVIELAYWICIKNGCNEDWE